ncbi:MAG: Arc family DNA-binding protein [Salipiger marinus]|uniref:Arc family DNA-binding protein n=1 Tax=Salipiger marinus TaxID=555512 RepID=UPI0040596545
MTFNDRTTLPAESPIQTAAGGEVVASSIRMPRALRDDLKIQAIRAGRSFNTHVVMLMKEAVATEAAAQK